MYNKYDFHNLMQSFFQSQVQSAQEFSKYKDQLSDSMLSLAHRHIDTSIQSLEKFHEHVSSDASTLKSDILAATLKTAIDHHNHFKNHLRLHKDSSNSRNQTFRRLAIGTSMAVFGLMSGVKASALQNTDGQSTPHPTAHAWTAEQASGKTSLPPPSTVHQSLRDAANAAQMAGDPERVLELWRTQQAFAKELENMLKKDSFDKILNAAFATELWAKKISNDERTALVGLVFKNTTFTDNQKSILQGLLPNALSHHIKSAAYSLELLGSDYHDRVATLYEQSALHKETNILDIYKAAVELTRFGTEYNDRVAALYELVANHPTASLDYILGAADGLRDLGSDYHDRAAELYKESANPYELSTHDQDANLYQIESAANALSRFGAEYHPKAAALFERGAHHQDATSNHIEWAANGLKALGSKYPIGSTERTQYNKRAATLYGLNPNHREATLDQIISVANKFISLGGAKHYPNAAKSFEQSADHQDANPFSLRQAADGLKALGSNYSDRASELFKKLGF
jgi:hypothetical protein